MEAAHNFIHVRMIACYAYMKPGGCNEVSHICDTWCSAHLQLLNKCNKDKCTKVFAATNLGNFLTHGRVHETMFFFFFLSFLFIDCKRSHSSDQMWHNEALPIFYDHLAQSDNSLPIANGLQN